MADTRNRVYFGNKERMTWVRAPDANYDGSRVGWDGGVTQYLNGGANVRRSTLAHRTYNLSWNMMSRDEIREIMDYADGVYGDGAIYYLDPFAMDKNLLPQHWAVPSLAYDDPYLLVGGNGYLARGTFGGGSNTRGFPTQSMVVEGHGKGPGIYIPIPEGHTAWLGVYGYAQDNGPVAVTPDGGAATFPAIIDLNASALFSDAWNGDLHSGITLTMGTDTQSYRGNVVGIMLRIYPNTVNGFAETVAPRFVSGQGHSGLRFSSQPSLTQYSQAIDKTSLSATLIEDEVWR